MHLRAVGAAFIAQMLCGQPLAALAVDNAPVIEADVRALVLAGRARVLIELRIPESLDAAARDEAISRAQDTVLSRVPATLVRRYRSVPLLALEIDAAGLRALDALGDVVVRVESDRTLRPQ